MKSLSWLSRSGVLLPALLPALLLAACGAALAASTAESAAEPGVEGGGSGRGQPLWEAGLFGLGGSQQAYPGSRQQVKAALVLPFFIYRGDIFRAEQGNVGVRAAHNDSAELDIGFAGSFGSAARESDARSGMPAIGTLVEFGPRVKWALGDAPWGGKLRATVPLRGVFDLSHRMRYQGLAFEPTLAWADRNGGWGYGVALSVLAGDRHLADTFYTVEPPFATAERPAYQARAGLIATRAALNLSRRLGPDWRLFFFARVDSVSGAANVASPLVDKRTGASGGLGLSWTWSRSDERAAQ